MIQPLDGIYYVSDRSFLSRIKVPLICGKSALAHCIVQDTHDKLGCGRDVLQILSSILTKLYIPGVRKLVLLLKKTCPGCLKLNRKCFSMAEADMPNVLKTVQPPFSYCQTDIFGPILFKLVPTQPNTGFWLFFVYLVVQYTWSYCTTTYIPLSIR